MVTNTIEGAIYPQGILPGKMRRFPVGHDFFFAPEEWGGYVVFFGGGEDDGSSIYSVLGQVSNFDVGPCLFNLSICLSTYGI